jgi:hypothetical protein
MQIARRARRESQPAFGKMLAGLERVVGRSGDQSRCEARALEGHEDFASSVS